MLCTGLENIVTTVYQYSDIVYSKNCYLQVDSNSASRDYNTESDAAEAETWESCTHMNLLECLEVYRVPFNEHEYSLHNISEISGVVFDRW